VIVPLVRSSEFCAGSYADSYATWLAEASTIDMCNVLIFDYKYAILQGASLQQFQGMELAGGFLVPPADERPGNMDPSEYLVTLAPKLLALQHLRQEPFKPHTFAEYKTKGGLPTNRPPRMEGMARLQEMLKREWEPQQRLNLKGALELLKMVSCIFNGRAGPSRAH
jgi:hypothetical protein